jgi:hypothetical protein
MPGAPWVVHEWLSELILALAYDALGWWGLVLLAAATTALALFLLARFLMARLEPLSMLVIVGLSAAMLMSHLVARPHVLAAPLLVGWCAGVIGARERGRAPPLALLPLMTLWANLHGGFLVGVALAGFFGAEAVLAAPSRQARWSACRAWGTFTLLALLASALTPNGIEGLLLPIRFLDRSVMQSNIAEWAGSSFEELRPFEIWLLGWLFAGFALGLKLPLSRLLLLVGLTHLALRHVRHVDLLALIGPMAGAAPLGPQIAALLAEAPPSPLRRWFAALARPARLPAHAAAIATMMAVAALCLLHPYLREDAFQTPGAALAAAERMELRGPVFNSEAFGGFLVFRGVKPFIDGRMEVYGETFLARYLEAAAGEQPALSDTLERYAIAWTLLEPGDGAVRMLDQMPGWRRAYTDEHAVIHVRTTPRS